MRHSYIIIAVVAFIAFFVWPNPHRPRGYRARRFRHRRTSDFVSADFILLRLKIERNVANGWLGFTPVRHLAEA